MGHAVLKILFVVCGLGQFQKSDAVYYGSKVADFANRFHNVKGQVYAVDSRTIFIKVRFIL